MGPVVKSGKGEKGKWGGKECNDKVRVGEEYITADREEKRREKRRKGKSMGNRVRECMGGKGITRKLGILSLQ